MTEAELVGIVRNLTRSGTGWHCSSDGLFVWEPTGDAIFVATTPVSEYGDDDDFIADVLSVCWKHGVDAADLCSQGYCFGDFANLTANETVCTGKHEYDAAGQNHSVLSEVRAASSSHDGHVSRNSSLDDDAAAERRCANITNQGGCEATAQCSWVRASGTCYDPTSNATASASSAAARGGGEGGGGATAACSSLQKTHCELRASCKWVAAASACENATYTLDPTRNHTVNASKHPNAGRIGRNQTLDDDNAAALRCANVTSQGECATTAQCAWSAEVLLCYDPAVVNASSLVSAVNAPLSNASAASDAASACAALVEGECKQTTLCEWSASEAACASAAAELAARRPRSNR